MEIKKFYSLIEVEKEIAFLDAQKGYKLVDYKEETYIFEESDQDYKYSIVMDDDENFTVEGYETVCVLPSKFFTWIHYMAAKDEPQYIDYTGHVKAAEQIVNRFDKFSIVILVSLAVFGIYAWYQSQSIVYFILVVAGLFGVGILYGYRTQYTKFIKRMQQGDYDMNK